MPIASTVAAPSLETRLDRAVDLAQDTLDRHSRVLAQSLAELGDIELPDGRPSALDAELLKPLGPFYLAFQLDQAGLLRTAEQIAGLYGSGVITAPLGAAGGLLRQYWQDRHNRLTDSERTELFGRVFEAPHFERMLFALMHDIAAHADNGAVQDLREAVALDTSARALADFLAQRASGMTSFAAQDIVASIAQALAFLREPALQAAFSVRSLWALVRISVSGDAATGATEISNFVDRARSGQTVLGWLAQNIGGGFRLDPRDAAAQELIAAAQRWLLATPKGEDVARQRTPAPA